MVKTIKRPNSGGLSLKKKHGNKYFKALINKRWEKFYEQKENWESKKTSKKK